jgi:hypothetical protein
MILNIILLAIIVGAGYYFWLRPILKTRPEFSTIFAYERSKWGAISVKLAGIKQKLAGAIIVLAGIYVEAANYVVPALTGVDTSVITHRLPDWTVPLIPIAATILLNYFRSLADKREE